MQQILSFLTELPPVLIYAILGAGAALENIIPPIPADTFVFLGGFLSATGADIDAWSAYLVVWASNVASALAVYAAGRKYGRGFFAEGVGGRILSKEHMERIQAFYDKWGTPAIFLTRFLPGLRAVVPAFAGVTHKPFLPVAIPLAVASAIWYGVLVWLGATAGRNVQTIWQWIQGTNRVLLGLAVLIFVGIGVWWWRARGDDSAGDDAEQT